MSPFNNRLSELVNLIYPDAQTDILASLIVEAFWPEDTAPMRHGRVPGNDLWSEKDALLITYGNSIVDGTHKPLDLLHDFLLYRMQGVLNSVHILPFFPYTSANRRSTNSFLKPHQLMICRR